MEAENNKTEAVEVSVCCNSDINWQKGAYMGQWEAECWRCGKPCEVKTVHKETR